MTQPTAQAIEQARKIAAEIAEPKWVSEEILSGKWDDHSFVQIALRALSAAASDREQLEARVKALSDERAELEALREYAREATKAITSLTAGGSEYFNGRIGEIYVADLPFCLKRIRASKRALHTQLTAALEIKQP